VAEKERELVALQAELGHLRAQQGDATQERRGLAPDKHAIARYADLCEGPRLSGLASVLITGADADTRSNWSEHRIEF
jgi:hypothetical protein